jgi:hypothetical protein
LAKFDKPAFKRSLAGNFPVGLLVWWFFKGRNPRLLAHAVLKASSLKPVGLNAKIRYRMANDRRSILKLCANKWTAREIVMSKVGPKYLPGLHQVLTSAYEVDWELLPEAFVAKAAWRSGGTFICLPIAAWGSPSRLDPEVPRLVGSRNALSRQDFVDFFGRLGSDYSWEPGRFPEWAYAGGSEKIMIEEFINDGSDQLPKDYKFFCFEGVPRFIQVDFPLKPLRDIYSVEWQKIPVNISYPNSPWKLDQPLNFPEMLRLARIMSLGLDFLRVDMYNVNGRIFIGELTCYPEGGVGQIKPRSYDKIWGEYWTI